MSISSEYNINSEGKLCKVVNMNFEKRTEDELIIQPVIIEFLINALREDGNGLCFSFNTRYVNSRRGW